MNTAPTPILTIAGSDCSAGAGIQADLKTFQHFHLHGLTAITGVVSETANTVRRVEVMPIDLVIDQVELMLNSFPLTVVKLGMLGSVEIVEKLSAIFNKHPHIKLVIDPVMVASTGDALTTTDLVKAYRENLLPLAYLATPNLQEAAQLIGRPLHDINDIKAAAADLHGDLGSNILIKGGHLEGTQCIDILSSKNGEKKFTADRIETAASHGTGCTLAAAIAACIALEHPLEKAIKIAKSYLTNCLQTAYSYQKRGSKELHALNQGTRHCS